MQPRPLHTLLPIMLAMVFLSPSAVAAPHYVDMVDGKTRMVRTLAADDAVDSRIRIDLMLYTNDVPPDTVDVWMVTPSGKIRLPVDSSGVIGLGAHEARLRDMTGFELDPYQEGFGFGARMMPDLPFASSIDPAEVREAVAAFGAIIKKEAGVLRFLAPRIKGIKARLEPGASATLTTTTGRTETIRADGDGWAEITWRLKSLARIEFSSTPTEYDFVD